MKASGRDTFFQFKLSNRVKGWTWGRGGGGRGASDPCIKCFRFLYIMLAFFRAF